MMHCNSEGVYEPAVILSSTMFIFLQILDRSLKSPEVENFFRQKVLSVNIIAIFQEKSQGKFGQNCRNIGLVSKILSGKISFDKVLSITSKNR